MTVWSQYLVEPVYAGLTLLRGLLDQGWIKVAPGWIQQHKLSFYITTGSAVLAIAWLVMKYNQNKDLPPGPWGLPFVGAVHVLGNDMPTDVAKLQKKYGDVHSLRIGSDLYIMVCGYEALKETLIKAGDDFAGRPIEAMSYFDQGSFKEELVMVDFGDKFKANKKFALSALKKFGFGLPALEGRIQEEITVLVEQINEHDGKPFKADFLIKLALAKVICPITIAGKGLEKMDYKKYIELFDAVFFDPDEGGLESMAAYLFPPWIANILFKSMFDKIRNIWESTMDFMRERLYLHRQSLDAENPRDVTDMYLLNKGEGADNIICSNLIMLQLDAVETLQHSILAGLGYVAKNPSIMKNIHEELDRVVGKTGPVTLNHKPNLPYMQATVLEINRYFDTFPLGITHKALRDSTIAGYKIPAGTYINPVLQSVHYDEKIFPNPEKFDPLHFLDGRGAVTKAEYCIPFSLGKRSCLGEPLAKMEQFLFFANLFHQFHISFPKEGDSQEYRKFMIFMNICEPFDLCFNKRS